MLPVIAIVGTPNVGKSTLFNRLTRTRDAIVSDEPGVTRDRQYGIAAVGDFKFVLVDTGGITDDRGAIPALTTAQARRAIDEADAVLFLVDGRAGPGAGDAALAAMLRRLSVPVYLVVNKTEGLSADAASAEFHALGLATTPIAVSSAHGHGVRALMQAVAEDLPAAEGDEDTTLPGVRVAIIGKPNVGKSTLVNRLLGEERVLAHDAPGTTRDSIRVPFVRDGKHFVLIDTAGIRRRSRVDEKLEKWSVIKALQSIEAANVVVLLIDAREGVTDQDATLLSQIEGAGRALVIGINKWDGLTQGDRIAVRRTLDLKLGFVDYAAVHTISALHGSGVGNLFNAVTAAWAAASADLSTPLLNNLLGEAITRHPPPLVHGRRVKLRYAHQGGSNPPRIVIHGNQTEAVTDAYRRYLARFFRDRLKLRGTPVAIDMRTGENPFKGRKNPLSERQVRKRKRLIRHVKR